MKRSKNFMNFILSAGFLLTLSAPAMAATTAVEKEVQPVSAVSNVSPSTLVMPEVAPNVLALDIEDKKQSMGEINGGISTLSAFGSTYEFTDYLTSSSDQKYMTFSLSQGQIANITLQGPNDNNIDYNLILASVSSTGSLTILKQSNLGTYVDETTPETVAEGISYAHTSSTNGTYAVFVVSASGSSTTQSFDLTLSFDVAGSYDSNEPNENPFEVKTVTTDGMSGSLHVSNDQDWYALLGTGDDQMITAGDYDVNVYSVVSSNQLKMVTPNSDGSYSLDNNKYYYIKAHSTVPSNQFSYGGYSLSFEEPVADVPDVEYVYNTFETAFDLGAWEYAYLRSPSDVPAEQNEIYYRFNIDSEDKAYIYSTIYNTQYSGVKITVYDNNRKELGESYYNYNGDGRSNGFITKSSGWNYLTADIDGSSTNSYAYIKIERTINKNVPEDAGYVIPASLIAHVNKRTYTGYGTFSYSGTASNSGYAYSSFLAMDLRSNSTIPDGAIVTAIETYGTISSSVGGVTHLVTAYNSDKEYTSSYSSSSRGSFKLDASDGIEAKQIWGFRYLQTAFASTTMKSVSMKLTWEYDINQTNYEAVY